MSTRPVPQPGATDPKVLRNFCIIAHIDHGKSTLADRMLQHTGVVDGRDMKAQYLDRMDIERERGITIKSQAVRMPFVKSSGDDAGEVYILNMIDTPGHVDFTYEVSRSLEACEGAVLLVDAAQGIEAQTLANLYLAIDADLDIIPVLNKIDLPGAQPEKYAEEIAGIIGGNPDDVLRVSAKTGQGVEELLNLIVDEIPPPKGDPDGPARALIFDSVYDTYRGVVTYVRVVDGKLSHRDKIKMMSTGAVHEMLEVGVISPEPMKSPDLGVGEVGYLITGVKEVRQSRVGDTVTSHIRGATEPLGGYKTPNPMVYSGLYPLDGDDYPTLRDALEKLQLNDAALVYEPESSGALGFGFRIGFLGLLHLEIVRERLEREFNLELISTAPNVVYRVEMEDGKEITVTNPSEYPSDGKIAKVYEPVVRATVLSPSDYIGVIMELCQARRGVLLGMDYLSEDRVEIKYTLPMGEIMFDFFDALKSRTKGYASLDYEPTGEQAADLVKVDVLLQGEVVDAFSAIVHRDNAYAYGVSLAGKLKELIPRQQFEVPIQAAIGARVIARENIRAIRKDVLAKCYGGDISRKRKLLEKQKEGKKRMKMVGRVEVPQEAFIAALSTGDVDKK
ncbi:translation elongation factor 4 [Aeromicrobium wangtongii]|uniref:Elongation factor 4 n=1 Tax=Aeromicrobium wangtongii TaxID=2969247 RepID=A0ABY5M9K4_9ACTN|nr:translation elongation factor 4 [Aeromicrobium wangtongii]MCD9197319.1 translation elongation factor 4 [Aeromicrobium wangtongii]MCL3818240.1 translation elongation factor 4 [Aeromicrobium wangtongii]UUP14813.1 translation elongation factor 4 [Aeromicrobium wangtongii]